MLLIQFKLLISHSKKSPKHTHFLVPTISIVACDYNYEYDPVHRLINKKLLPHLPYLSCNYTHKLHLFIVANI